MKYARVVENIVVETIEPANDFTIDQMFHADFVASLVECGADVEQGWLQKNGKFEAPTAQEVPSLDAIKEALKRLVDASAETERLKYITPGTGQAMTYQQKVAEAQAYKAATNPQASDYPILSSEVGITSETFDDVANIVLAAFAQWQQIGAMIESIRLGAKRDIDAAGDETTARAVVDAAEWPQPAL